MSTQTRRNTMRFNQRGNISTLKGCSLKLVDKFTYLGSSFSSTETDINTRIAKSWIVIDRLSDLWKSDQTNKMKHRFFSNCDRVDTAIWMHYMDANWRYGEKVLTATIQECCEQYWTSPGGNTPQSSSCTATYHPFTKTIPVRTNQTFRTLLGM